jgi:hypothetical protein
LSLNHWISYLIFDLSVTLSSGRDFIFCLPNFVNIGLKQDLVTLLNFM